MYRNTLDRSVMHRVPPGYTSPRDNPDLANVMDENIYCDPAEDSPAEEPDQIYKVPRLSTDPVNTIARQPQPVRSAVRRTVSGSSSGEESCHSSHSGHRRVDRMSSQGPANPRRSPGNSSRSASNSLSPPPVDVPQQSVPVLKKPPVRPKPPTKPKPKQDSKPDTNSTPEPKPETDNSDSEILENDVYVQMEGSDPMRKKSMKRAMSENHENPYMSMNSVEHAVPSKRSASVPTVSYVPKPHTADDYEDLDKLEEKSETPPLPALDDYVDMSGPNPIQDLKKGDELAKTNSKTNSNNSKYMYLYIVLNCRKSDLRKPFVKFFLWEGPQTPAPQF